MPGSRAVPFGHSAVIADVAEGDIVRIVNVFYGGRDYQALSAEVTNYPDYSAGLALAPGNPGFPPSEGFLRT